MSDTEAKQVAVVTGGSRGIGKAIAFRLADIGFHVVSVSRTESSGAETVAGITEKGGSAEALGVDVSDGEAVQKACEDILSRHGNVEVLVNNAGITRDGLFIRMTDDDWDQVLKTNLYSCFHWTRHLIRPMARSRRGRIINISSVIGLIGNAGQANYAAAKVGMIGMTKSLAREFASRTITFNAIAPGFIETDMTSELDESVREQIVSQVPLKRMGSAEEIAAMVGYLVGPDAGYITGQVFTVDGGMVM